MSIPSLWPVSNLAMYGTPPACAVTFGIGEGIESVKLGFLANLMLNWSVWWHNRFLRISGNLSQMAY